jgi:tetratricopeptide (TPR) repeat protein
LLAKQVGSKKEQIPLEWALTTYHLLRGEMHKAVSGGRRVLGLAEHANDDDFLLVAHSAMSIYEFYSGNFVDAVGHKEKALRFYREKTSEELQKTFGTDRRLQALRGAALSHWCIGNHQIAIELDEEQRSRATRHPFDYTYSLTISCILHSLSRNSQMMRSFAETAITIAQDQGFGFLEANAANFRAIALTLQNPSDSMLREFDETIEKYQTAGNQMGISSMLAIIGEHCGNMGLAERGLIYVDRGLDYVRRSGEHFAQSDLYRVKGMLLAALNRTGEAQRCLARALLIAQQQKAKTWELGAAIPLAQILRDRGEFKKSRKLLQPLCHEFEGSKFVSEQLVQAHNLTAQCQSLEAR